MVGSIERVRQFRWRGYTLIEFVTVVGILIVMTAVAFPVFTTMMKNSQLDAAARQIATDLRDARSLATQTGWQYRLVGFNAGGGQAKKNQYHLVGRSSSGVAWPADGADPFQSATQMAGNWVDFTRLYPNVSLNSSVTNPSFYVSFASTGAALEFNPTAAPWVTVTQSGATTSRQLSITWAGNVKIQ